MGDERTALICLLCAAAAETSVCGHGHTTSPRVSLRIERDRSIQPLLTEIRHF